MSEERNEVHIKTYDEWLKYYKNATKEQVIEDLTRDVQYFADAVKDIKDLQQKVEQLEKEIDRLNNIINELENTITNFIENHTESYIDWKYDREIYLAECNILQKLCDTYFDKLTELKENNKDV